MVSSIGDTRTPRRAMTAMSYLMFWPTLRTAGSSSSVFSRARAVGLSIWVRAGRASSIAPKSSPPAPSSGAFSWVRGT